MLAASTYRAPRHPHPRAGLLANTVFLPLIGFIGLSPGSYQKEKPNHGIQL
jgi:hypothetical protein